MVEYDDGTLARAREEVWEKSKDEMDRMKKMIVALIMYYKEEMPLSDIAARLHTTEDEVSENLAKASEIQLSAS